MTITAPATDQLDTPLAHAIFDEIWAGRRNGYSEKFLQSSLALTRDLRERLVNGDTTPAQIVGEDDYTLALGWLDQEIGEYQEAIDTRGRSYPTNQANVRDALIVVHA